MKQTKLVRWLLGLSPYGVGLVVFTGIMTVIDSSAPIWLIRFLLASAMAVLVGGAIEWLVVRHAQNIQSQVEQTPNQVLASAILQYAKSLNDANRDVALIELRSWASRILHLLGERDARRELGNYTLSAACALEKPHIQASILMDDLGWTVHQLGNDTDALSNIKESQIILARLIEQDRSDTQAIEMLIKAYRHEANIKGPQLPLNDARGLLERPRKLLADLHGADKALAEAQLDHTEASLILESFERDFGEASIVDPGGDWSKLLDDALALCNKAEHAFKTLGDLERDVKAVTLRVRILSHYQRKQPLLEASVQLERLKKVVSRTEPHKGNSHA